MNRRTLLQLAAALAAGTALSTAAWAKTVTHEKGTVEVPDNPQRVVGMYSTDADNALVLGLHMVGVGTARGADSQGWALHQQQFDLSDAQPVAIFPNANYEKIAGLQPDLIVASYLIEENGYELLSAIAPTVWLPYADGWKAALRFLAHAVNKTDVAEAFITDYDAKLAAFKAKVPANTVIVDISTRGDGTFQIIESEHRAVYYDDLGFVTGAIVPAKQAERKQYSIEQIGLLEEADIITLFRSPSDDGKGRLAGEYDFLINAPGWSELKAVKAGKVYEVPAEYTYSSPLTAVALLDYFANNILV